MVEVWGRAIPRRLSRWLKCGEGDAAEVEPVVAMWGRAIRRLPAQSMTPQERRLKSLGY